MKRILLAVVALLALSGTPVLACAPAPSCWLRSSPAYLKSVCQGYAKDHQTLKQIAMYFDEPEKIVVFGEACDRLGVNLKPD